MVWDEASESWGYPNRSYAASGSEESTDEEGYEDEEPDTYADDGDAATSDESMDDGSDDTVEDAADEGDDDAVDAANDAGAVSSVDDSGSTSSDDGYANARREYDAYNQPQADPKFFTEQVVPILRAHCYNCHGGGPRGRKGNVELHSPTGIDESVVVSASDVNGSLLYQVIKADADADVPMMPPRGPRLSQQEVDTIAKWIRDGASFGDAPRDAAPYAASGASDGYDEDPYAAYGERGDGRDAPPPAAPPQNLAEWASRSFQDGRDRDAMNLLYAQALVRSADGESVLEKYRWVPALKRAKLAIRWGVGVDYSVKFGYEGNPRAVGVVQNLPGDEFDDVDEIEDLLPELKNQTLDYYAGDIAEELLLRLKMRIEKSYYGDVLSAELGKILTGSRDDEEDFYGDDGYGEASRRGRGYDGYGGGEDRDSDKPDGDAIEQVMPGVTCLGVADRGDLFQRAREQGVDLLVIFDVAADPNNVRRFVDTSTRVRLFDVQTEEQVAVTGKIGNVEMQKKRVENPDDETIIEEMNKIFEPIDETYRAKPFPDVTNDNGQKAVIGFVRKLLVDPSKNPLWKLAEVRFYEHRGGLQPNHAASAYAKIVPSKAKQLYSVATDDEARALLAEWLTVRDDSSASDDEDFDDEDEGRGRRVDSFR